MKAVATNLVLLALIFYAEPVRGIVPSHNSHCPSDPLLPDSSRDRSHRVRAIRQMIAKNNYDMAMQLAEDLIRTETTNHEGYFWKGYLQRRLRQFYSAVKTLRTAERLNPPGNAVAKLLSICYESLDQRQLFIRKMQEAVTLDPSDSAPHYYLGRNVAASFKCDDAVSYFKAALERNPSDYFSNYELGYCFESSGLLEQARRQYDLSTTQAEQCHAKFSLPFAGLSRTALLENDLSRALAHARTAVQLDPNSAANRMLLAQVLIRVGLEPEAVSALKLAITLDPTASSLYYLLYRCYLKTGQNPQALATLSEFKKVLSYYGEGLP